MNQDTFPGEMTILFTLNPSSLLKRFQIVLQLSSSLRFNLCKVSHGGCGVIDSGRQTGRTPVLTLGSTYLKGEDTDVLSDGLNLSPPVQDVRPRLRSVKKPEVPCYDGTPPRTVGIRERTTPGPDQVFPVSYDWRVSAVRNG